MKPQLDDTARRNLVTYRLSRSHSALDEVEYLAKGEFYSSAVSRLYYACYYAELFDLRHANDYDDFHVCDKETIEVMLPLAKEFIAAVENIINK